MEKQVELFKQDKVDIAIKRLQMFEPKEGYYLAFSGGKDSIVIKELCNIAGVKYDAHYSVTTVDPPELTRFIKHHHPDVIWERPEMNMWSLIVKRKMPPTRITRYCCDYLKEGGGEGRVVVTGVRWAESLRRRNTREEVEILSRSKSKKYLKEKEIFLNADNDEKRRMFETCFNKRKRVVNPIVEWTDEDVWEFIKSTGIPYCSLYDEGFTRLGCVGCPLAGKKGMEREFKRWAVYKKNYIRAFDKMLIARRESGMDTIWKTGEEVMEWWIGNSKNTDIVDDDQLSIIDIEGLEK